MERRIARPPAGNLTSYFGWGSGGNSYIWNFMADRVVIGVGVQ
jgi:hypothetical protein